MGFVLISLKHTDERTALDDLKALPDVKEAYVLFGEWLGLRLVSDPV